MKNLLKLLGVIAFFAVIGFSMTACPVPDTTVTPETGSVNGKALFNNSGNHAGITISLEKTDGLRSVAAVSAARGMVEGARSIDGARAILSNKQTNEQGEYEFDKLIPGSYTIYASSQNSLEKAVLTNVIVAAGSAVTADDLNLTAVGSITGRIVLDETETGNLGFLVCVAGTSFMAATADNGTLPSAASRREAPIRSLS